MGDWSVFKPTAQSVRIMAMTDPTNNRRPVVMLDQHRHRDHPEGRAWWGFVERAANGALNPGLTGDLYPINTATPIRGKVYKPWNAPWFPDSKYINMAVGLQEGNHFEINYGLMEAEYRQAEDGYYQRAIGAALAHDLPVPVLGGPVDYAVQAIVGRAPKSSRLPRAAMTGHQWLLGFNDEPDELLLRLISPTSGHADVATMDEHRKTSGEVQTLQAQVQAMQKLLAALAAKGAIEEVPTPEKPKRKGATQTQQDNLAKGRAALKAKRESAAMAP